MAAAANSQLFGYVAIIDLNWQVTQWILNFITMNLMGEKGRSFIQPRDYKSKEMWRIVAINQTSIKCVYFFTVSGEMNNETKLMLTKKKLKPFVSQGVFTT